MTPVIAVYILWPVWILTWVSASHWLNPTVKRTHFAWLLGYRLLAIVGALLLLGVQPIPRYDLRYPFWPMIEDWSGWLLVAATLAGFAMAWWARIQFGRVWSDNLNHGHIHRLIDTGPYALVRHPVYTGIIISSFASAAIFGLPWRIAGALVMSVGFVIKAYLEELFLREQLAGSYDAYAKRVPLLVPFFPQNLWPSPEA
jgi:protein-S-isoprenylcysteine O-methyltransferase Ste14